MNTNSPVDMIAGHRQRQADVPHDLEPVRALERRGLLEALRDRVEVRAQHVDRHGHRLRRVDDDQADQGAAQPDPGEEHEQRDRQQDRREQVDGQEQRADLAPAEELAAG